MTANLPHRYQCRNLGKRLPFVTRDMGDNPTPIAHVFVGQLDP